MSMFDRFWDVEIKPLNARYMKYLRETYENEVKRVIKEMQERRNER